MLCRLMHMYIEYETRPFSIGPTRDQDLLSTLPAVGSTMSEYVLSHHQHSVNYHFMTSLYWTI